jgi:hypothetical protein
MLEGCRNVHDGKAGYIVEPEPKSLPGDSEVFLTK